MSLGTGRPIILRDENSIRHCRLLLSHRMTSPTDVRLIALIELIARKSMELIQEKKRLLTCDRFHSTDIRNSSAYEGAGKPRHRSIHSTSQPCSGEMVG
jgi:hypothetical protein